MNLIEQMRLKREAMTSKAKELSTLSAKEDYTAEDDAACEVLKAELATLTEESEKLTSRNANVELAGKLDAFLASNTIPDPVALAGTKPAEPLEPATATLVSPATYSHVRLKHIQGEKGGVKAHTRAHNFGQWALAMYGGNEKAIDFCKQNGTYTLAHFEGNNATGGWLVPDEISSDIIDLRDSYGLFRQFAKIKKMSSDHWEGRVRKGGLEAYPATEGETVAKSEMEYGNIELTARKWLVLAENSSELNEDSFISWADEMTGEIARAFAKKEDQCGFFGDGSAAYHKITGIIPALTTLSGTVANITPLQVASGNEWSDIVLSDLIGVTGRVRSLYTRNDQMVWICSNQFYTQVMLSLAMASNGTAAPQVVNGVARNTFLGYPVIIADQFPVAQANSQVPCLFGALSQAITFGDRAGLGIAQSNDVKFENDMTVWRGRERFDIDAWNIGNASVPADVKNEDFGPVAGLIMASA